MQRNTTQYTAICNNVTTTTTTIKSLVSDVHDALSTKFTNAVKMQVEILPSDWLV